MYEEIIKQIVAIDSNNIVLGIYAVDANDIKLPGINYYKLIDFPDQPIGTGKFIEVPIDPENPNLGEHSVEILSWPEVGWKWDEQLGFQYNKI